MILLSVLFYILYIIYCLNKFIFFPVDFCPVICLKKYACVYVYIYIYTCVPIYTHTHIHVKQD